MRLTLAPLLLVCLLAVIHQSKAAESKGLVCSTLLGSTVVQDIRTRLGPIIKDGSLPEKRQAIDDFKNHLTDLAKSFPTDNVNLAFFVDIWVNEDGWEPDSSNYETITLLSRGFTINPMTDEKTLVSKVRPLDVIAVYAGYPVTFSYNGEKKYIVVVCSQYGINQARYCMEPRIPGTMVSCGKNFK